MRHRLHSPGRIFTMLLALLLFTISVAQAQYAPPAGGEDFFDLLSPLAVGQGSTVTAADTSAASALNPAASALTERLTVDLSYVALAGLGDKVTGIRGHVLNIGGLLPTRAGVIASSLHLLTSAYDSVELGTSFAWNLSMAKALQPSLLVGVAGNLYLGGSAGKFSAGVTADLGIVHFPVYTYGLPNLRIALALLDLGKAYTPIDGRSGLPSPFTPRVGLAFDPVASDDLTVSVFGDVAFPSFQNLRLSVGGLVTFQEILSLYAGWRIDLRQISEADIANRSLIPSIGLSVNFTTDFARNDSFVTRRGWNESEVKARGAAAPLYNGVWALSTGVTMPLGRTEGRPPTIEIDYEEVTYISPNNDGINDDLVVPVTISVDGLLKGYSFRIVDDRGATVRTIRNKEDRPEAGNPKTVLDQMFAVQTGIAPPEEIRWDGTAQDGAIVPDGRYRFYLSVWDENESEVGPFEVVVDNTPPRVSVDSLPRDALLFSPNGDGIKDVIRIVQEGSREEYWSAWFENSVGERVFETTWRNSEPDILLWEGRDNSGEVLPDGVYSYRIATVDRAGNSAAGRLENIIISNQFTPITLDIDTAYISPNGDGRADLLTFYPTVPVRGGILSWQLEIRDSAEKVVRELADVGPPPSKISFNGRTDTGRSLPEGAYYGRIRVRYENGNLPEATSPSFIVDLTPPTAVVQADIDVFSPNGDGNLDAVTFFQETTVEQRWVGRITDSRGTVVRTFEWAQQAEPQHVWTGRNDAGRPVPDGSYQYTLESTDKAGNVLVTDPVTVVKDTTETAIVLTAEFDVFSPNADGTRDRVRLFPEVRERAQVTGYEIAVQDSAGRSVRTFTGRGAPPESIAWDGTDGTTRRVPDGTYSAKMNAAFTNGNREEARSGAITVDTTFPQITITAPYTLFSPDGDGRRDSVPIRQQSSVEALWEGSILSPDGTVVKSFFWSGRARSFEWDGTDEAGNTAPNGSYLYRISATDAAGNTASNTIDGILLDSRPATVFVTAERTAFSPNGDDLLDEVEIQAYASLTDGATSWELAIVSDNGSVARRFTGDTVESPIIVVWDGTDEAGRTIDGTYTARFSIEYAKGNRPVEMSAPFVLDTTAPRLSLVLSPLPFSPDNDGIDDELEIEIDVEDATGIRAWRMEILDRNNRPFHQFSGRSTPADRIVWDGRSSSGDLVISAESYPYRFTISDEVGNITQTTGTIPVDILVVREGNRLKVQIADITFQPNSPLLVTDQTSLQGAKNQAILRRLAEVFDRYRTYNVRIEGHAVNTSGTEREEQEELRPLSLARAEEVKAALVELGVNPRRITTLGRGGTEPLVPHADEENRWKNRRVEFILLK